METYEFHHRFPDLAMDRNSAHAITFSADVNATLDEMVAADFGIPATPSTGACGWAESGTNSRTEIHLFFADDSASTTRAFTPPDYTIYHTSRVGRRHHRPADGGGGRRPVRALQVFAVVLKTAALIAVLAGVVLLSASVGAASARAVGRGAHRHPAVAAAAAGELALRDGGARLPVRRGAGHR